jgi:hypothetical protein
MKTKSATGTDKPSLYSVHPGLGMMEEWLAELKTKTGRSLNEWMDFIHKSGPPTEVERRDWLKSRFSLGTNTCWWLAERSVGKGGEDHSPEAYLKAAEVWVEAMFVGKRAHLRPVYDALLELGLSIGQDVKACPGKTIVPLYRNHVFAQIKPATNMRIDLGFALKDTKATGRLVDTGGFAKKDRITHYIAITSPTDIDGDVKRWLKKAYEMDAG